MGLIDDKTESRKSRDTVPLSKDSFYFSKETSTVFPKLSMYNAECAPYRIGLVCCIRKIEKCHTFSVQAFLFEDQRKF
jgi:hypothetical protein